MSRRTVLLPHSGLAAIAVSLSDMTPELILTVKPRPDPPTLDTSQMLRQDVPAPIGRDPRPGTKAHRIASKKWKKRN